MKSVCGGFWWLREEEIEISALRVEAAAAVRGSQRWWPVARVRRRGLLLPSTWVSLGFFRLSGLVPLIFLRI